MIGLAFRRTVDNTAGRASCNRARAVVGPAEGGCECTPFSPRPDARYKSAGELPKPNGEVSFFTEIWFKLTDVPEKYDQMLLQVDLYRCTGGGVAVALLARRSLKPAISIQAA
jgi:hypothetical protein